MKLSQKLKGMSVNAKFLFRGWMYQGHNLLSLGYFLDVVRLWMQHQPIIVRCGGCGTKMWWNGKPDYEPFCSQECEQFYEWQRQQEQVQLGDEEIPF